MNAWDRQAEESTEAYEAFRAYVDMDERVVGKVPVEGIGKNAALRWSATWSWGFRAHEYDKFMSQVDQQELIRYRRQMNQRHRSTARFAQQKIVQWLANLNPDKLRPTEAARWYEIAVRVEREASGAALSGNALQEEPLTELVEPAEEPMETSLSELIQITPDMEARAAEVLFLMQQQGAPDGG